MWETLYSVLHSLVYLESLLNWFDDDNYDSAIDSSRSGEKELNGTLDEEDDFNVVYMDDGEYGDGDYEDDIYNEKQEF